jgi:hypothetical protein
MFMVNGLRRCTRAIGIFVTTANSRENLLRRATRANVASISGSPRSARAARVDRLAGTAARLFSTSSPCFLMCNATIASRPGVDVEVIPGDELVRQALGFITRPSPEGGEKSVRVDQTVLKREQSEKEEVVGYSSHGAAPNSGGRSGAGTASWASPEIKRHRADYRESGLRLHPCRRASPDADTLCSATSIAMNPV